MLSCDDSLGPHGQRMGFPRQEYWGGLPFPPPGDLPNPGIKPITLESAALAGGFLITSTPWGLEGTDPKVRDREFPGSVIKNLPANAGDTETRVRSLGWEDALGKEMATHPSIPAWEIP